jgi:hypothetical protein
MRCRQISFPGDAYSSPFDRSKKLIGRPYGPYIGTNTVAICGHVPIYRLFLSSQ